MPQEQGPERAEEMGTSCVGAQGYLTVMRLETQALDFRCEGRGWRDWLRQRGGDRRWMGVCPRMNGRTETGNTLSRLPQKGRNGLVTRRGIGVEREDSLKMGETIVYLSATRLDLIEMKTDDAGGKAEECPWEGERGGGNRAQVEGVLARRSVAAHLE